MLKLEIVNAERPEGMERIMVSTRIPLSKEAKGLTDNDLSEVIPYILSTHRLYNGRTLNCIVRRVISFNPLAIDSLLVVIEAETGILMKDKEKGVMTAIKVIEDLTRRYSTENCRLEVNVFGGGLSYNRKSMILE